MKSNVFCYNLYAILLRKYSATLLSLAGLIAPVSAAITSWLYFGERVTWGAYVTGALVIIGFYLFYSEELRIKKAANLEVDDDVDESFSVSD